uniref:Uncharacterized protein n=1 Tax=Sarcophilus harrisii TaxID=9305 RepID=A0A7N4PPD7_SARHA
MGVWKKYKIKGIGRLDHSSRAVNREEFKNSMSLSFFLAFQLIFYEISIVFCKEEYTDNCALEWSSNFHYTAAPGLKLQRQL